MTHTEIESAVISVLEPVARKLECAVYDVIYKKEGGRYHLCVFLHKDDGVTFDLCEAIHRALSDAVDSYNIIEGEYILEVSSRGLERHIRKPEHYAGAIGETVSLRLKTLVQGMRNIKGTLVSFEDNNATIKSDRGEVEVDIGNVTKCNILFDFDAI